MKKQIEYNYNELKKLLVILSLPIKSIIEIYGYGNIGEEIANDYETHFNGNKNEYRKHKLLTNEQYSALEEIEIYFQQKSKNKDYDFFENIENHSGWNEIKMLANKTLKLMHMENYGIKAEIINTTIYYKDKSNLDMQNIKTELIKKNAAEQAAGAVK